MNSGTRPDTSNDLNILLSDFIDYVYSFYGADDAVYPMKNWKTKLPLNKDDVLIAVHQYFATINKRNSDTYTWGDGDSLDRERVRDILLNDWNFYLVHLQHDGV